MLGGSVESPMPKLSIIRGVKLATNHADPDKAWKLGKLCDPVSELPHLKGGVVVEGSESRAKPARTGCHCRLVRQPVGWHCWLVQQCRKHGWASQPWPPMRSCSTVALGCANRSAQPKAAVLHPSSSRSALWVHFVAGVRPKRIQGRSQLLPAAGAGGPGLDRCGRQTPAERRRRSEQVVDGLQRSGAR